MLKNNMRICLLSCCAPCSAGAIVELKERDADFCVLFFNPNIFPDTEYQKRLVEQIRLCEFHNVKYFVGEYDHDNWRACVQGLEGEPERGRRCAECFKMRIAWAAQWARDNGYNTLATVLGVSKHKDQNQVDAAASMAIGNGVKYIPIQWNEPRRMAENRRHNFYRQNYCGCEFSV